MSGVEQREGVHVHPNAKKPYTAYKLLVDPCLLKGASKLYRFDGHVPDDLTYPTVIVRDPRSTLSISRLWNRFEGVELRIPKFKIDENYVGIPPPVEVTITNINDNIDKVFLTDLLQKHGPLEELFLYYHPTTKKHLGLARVVFETVKASKACVEKLNNTPVMGRNLSVYTDPFGEKCKKIYEDLTIEKPVELPKPDERVDMYAKSTPFQRSTSSTTTKESHLDRGNPGSTRRPSRVGSSDSEFLKGPVHGQGHGPGRAAERVHETPRPVPPPYDRTSVDHDDHSRSRSRTSIPDHEGSGISKPSNTERFTSWSIPKTPSSQHPTSASVAPTLHLPKKPAAQMQESQHDGTEPGHKMDLDTRIKLLLKSKNSTPFGKFFGFEASDSEPEEKVEASKVRQKRSSLTLNRNEIWDSDSNDSNAERLFAKKFKKNTFVPVEDNNAGKKARLSPPPSPFLTHEDYDSWKRRNRNTNNQGAASDGLDEVSDASDLPSPTRNQDNSVDPSSIQLPPDPKPPEHTLPPAPPYPFPPQMLPMNQYYPNAQGFPQPIPHQGFVHPWQYQTWGPATAHSMSYPPPLPPPYYSQPYGYHDPPPPLPPPPEEVPAEEDTQHKTDLMIKAVFQHLLDELRSIMRRDFQRKLVENVAFKDYETWWIEKDQENKEQEVIRASQRYSSLRNQPQRPSEWAKTENPITAIDGSAIGLGFRASMPKLPSFRIQRVAPRPPSPVRVEEGRKSLDESDLDDESEVETRRQRTRRLSLSTETSLSSSSDSSDLDTDDDSLSITSSLESISHKVVFNKSEKEVRDDIASWVESISEEEAFSPISAPVEEKQVSPIMEVPRESSTKLDMEDEEIVDVEEMDVESHEPKSPEPPKSPERVGPGGPYVHLHDHCYCMAPMMPYIDREEKKEEPATKDDAEGASEVKPAAKKERVRKKSVPKATCDEAPLFKPRTAEQERAILTEFLEEGVDEEDLFYIKTCYEMMLADETQGYWLKPTHWEDHPHTKHTTKSKSRRVHATGSARTEGFYKLTPEEKQKHKQQWAMVGTVEYSAPGTSGAIGVTALTQDKSQGKTHTEKSREARSNQRRLLTALGNELDSSSDLLKFNQLKFRKKSLCFRRSTIHDWGLFAAEPIAADEMVIEYVGQTIRPYLADVRERNYEASGIGSSYLFRIDFENIIDATKCGNLSRFINHSCSPNCYAKIITIEGQKKIVIYSRQQIGVNEEITYDYKFPIEEQKIPCLCGTTNCRGTLN